MSCLTSLVHQHDNLMENFHRINYQEEDCVSLSSTTDIFTKFSASFSSADGSAYFKFLKGVDESLSRIDFINEIVINAQRSDIGDEDDSSSHRHDDLEDIDERKANGVRFEVDDIDHVIEHCYEYSTYDGFEVYMTSEEEIENQRRLAKQTRRFRETERGLISCLNFLYEDDDKNQYQYLFNDWCSSELRGFESALLNESRFQIENYVDFVITYYRNLQGLATYPGFDNDIHEELRERIVLLSQKSREFAQRLADADEVQITSR